MAPGRIWTLTLAATAAAALALAAAGSSREGAWRELAPGLELARFSSRQRTADDRGDVVVVRVDPARWDLAYHAAAAHGGDSRTARGWADELRLAAAINGGMYQADKRSHVGFLQTGGVVRNGSANDYLSAAAFGPRRPSDPPFRIFDLDETPLDSLRRRYDTVVQNLRLVRRPRDNRWTARDRGWAEAALGEDATGRALLIFCQSAYSMRDLNDVLLALPLDLQCAQHLEGNLPAQLHVSAGGVTLTLPPGDAPPIPNVLGVKPRS